MNDFTDAVDREAAWFKADQSAQGIPHLIASARPAGPFDIVQADLGRPSARGRTLYLWLENVEERRYALARKLQIYSFVASCLWQRTKAAGQTQADQQGLAAAVAKVVQRVRGPIGDKTHGGRFTAAGEIETGRIVVRFDDPLRAFQTADIWRADVRWQAVDDLPNV